MGVFDATWSGQVLNDSMVFLILQLLVLAAVAWVWLLGRARVLTGALFVLLCISFLAAFATAPKDYKVSGTTLKVRRMLWPSRVYDLNGLRSAHVDEKGEIFIGSVRVWASGGMWGYYGTYSSPTLNRFRAYATRGTRLVVLAFDKEVLVLSPDKVQPFLEELHLDAPDATVEGMETGKQGDREPGR